jgi:N4-(beta-N-acetylglucosaminyl)-L-asparaginase
MKNPISRRKFVASTIGAGTGAFIFPNISGMTIQKTVKGIRPLIITSHTNETGRNAMEAGWEILKAGGNAVDAVEKAANIIEVDPEDTSVGYGGLPNEQGVVQLDSSFMDGKTYSAGAVACLENIKTPSSVAAHRSRTAGWHGGAGICQGMGIQRGEPAYRESQKDLAPMERRVKSFR